MAGVDVITYEVLRARLDGIVREMEVAVMRTGFSTIVRESRDFSCCLTDHEGQVVGQGGHPSHMGAYPESVRGLLQFFSLDDMADGDAFLINHPYYSGCAHPNDMVVDELGVSRPHAGIRGGANGYWISDLGSRNGTFVNGEQVD